jgi:Ca-activated chloride channel family protein
MNPMSPPPLPPEKAALLVTKEGQPVPLRGVSVTGRVFGAHARVVLRQRYQNAEARPVEAIYTFPVPSDAALVGFAMEAAGRRIEAEVQQREAAFRAYDDAVSKGHGAALLEEERRNVFTASVGNLLPGEETVVEVVYVQPLAADEGALRLAIPTLVAPRYIPGAPAGDRTGHGVAAPTDRVPDADRISPAIGAVSYGLTIDVVFDLGREITLESPSHAVVVADAGGHARRVTLKQPEVPLDRDLVLTASGAPGVAAGVIAERRAGQDGTFALTVVPDLFDPAHRATPRDVVFVVDVSGSMEGASLREAKSALRLCLRHLAEGDRFQIISFSDAFYLFKPEIVPFTQRTLTEADAWVQALDTIGGTEMREPLLAAADILAGSAGRDRIMVLLTDGQVGNEAEIVRDVVARAGTTRIYTFGIGTSVSDLLIRDLARRTRGASELIHPGERIDEKVTAQFARATAARIEGVTLRWSGVDAGEIAPAEIGDLVDGEPWVVYGRYTEPGHGRAELRGTLRGAPFYLEVPVELPAEADREGLAALWATARIRDLEEAPLEGRRAEANRERIVALSIAHHVASKYASFVLVEKRTGDRRAQGLPEARPIPVSAPAGWAMFQPPEEEAVLFSLSAAAPVMHAPGGQMVGRIGGFAKLATADADDFMLEGGPAAPATGAPPPPAAPMPARAFSPVAYAPPPPSESGPQAPEAYDEVSFEEDDRAEPPVVLACAPEPMPVDRLAALFASQLASGLWEGADGTDAGRLLATARALEDCADNRIDSAHPVYGAQVKKAVEALCALALRLAADPAADAAAIGLALVSAVKVAAGKRLRAEVMAAIAQTKVGPKLRGESGPS